MGHHYITQLPNERYKFSKRGRLVTGFLMIVGLLIAGFGALRLQDSWQADNHSSELHENPHTDNHNSENHIASTHAENVDHHSSTHVENHSEGHHSTGWLSRVWAAFLVNAYYFFLFAVGGLFFVAVNYVANAGWATLIKRVAESMSSYIPIGFVLLMAAVYFGGEHLYEWLYYNNHKADLPADHLLDDKKWFLNKNWLYIAPIIFVTIWYALRTVIRRLSLKEDHEGGLMFFNKSIRFSAAFIVIFAFTFSVFSWLIMMSIDPHWFSTIFSVYNFAIMFVSSVTVITFITIFLKGQGYMNLVDEEILDDLVKFMFGFSIFWAYIWLAQFLLIWYANLPEESIYYYERWVAKYYPFFVANILMNFFLPFLVLIARYAKRNKYITLFGGILILVGHWLDIYLMVMPGVVGEKAGIGPLEIGFGIFFLGLFCYVLRHSLSKADIYPKNHPFVLESANHEVGP